MAEETTKKSKPGIGKRILKGVVWTAAIAVVAVVLALVSSPLWLGALARGIATSKVPELTGCKFRLDRLYVNPLTGRLEIDECRLKNPEGYKSEEAFAVSKVVVDVAVLSLMSDEIHVETIEVTGLRASYLSDSKGVNNFKRIAATATGTEPGAEPTEEELAAKKAEEEAAKSADKSSGPKVVIDHFALKDSEVSYQIVRGTPPITIPLPSVVLDGIGKDKAGGASLEEAWNAICQACMKAGGVIGDAASAAVGAVGDMAAGAVGAVGDAAVGAVGAVGDAAGKAAGAVGDTAGKAAGAVGDTAGKAVGAVGDAVGKTAGAVGDAAGKAAGAVGDAAGKAAGAVGDAAGNAVKSIGNLFKGKDK